MVGARGPQDGVGPAAGAPELDMGIVCPASGQQFAAMAATDLGKLLLFHGMQSCCAHAITAYADRVSLRDIQTRRILCG